MDLGTNLAVQEMRSEIISAMRQPIDKESLRSKVEKKYFLITFVVV